MEGSAGGGTGMNCSGFKGGNGTASRLVELGGEIYTVAVFLQANFGDRSELVINGVPMGDLAVPFPMGSSGWLQRDKHPVAGAGSVIAVVATDAPMIPQQCEALARRVPMGLARTGTTGGHFSGDIFLALSTGNPGALDSGFPSEPAANARLRSMSLVPWNRMDGFYAATVHAVEEAVLNALVSNTTMVGRLGHVSPALPHDLVVERLRGGVSRV